MSNHRFSQRAALILAGSSLLLAFQAVIAAPVAKTGVAYTKVDSATTVNSIYVRVVELTLPAGKYLVTGKGTVNNQQSATDTVSCNVYADPLVLVDASTATVPSGEYAVLAFNGVATLTALGKLWVECIATQQTTGPFTAVRLTATTIADAISQ